MAGDLGSWVLQFDCGEACIVADRTRADCLAMVDDLGCLPVAVYPLYRVRLKREPSLSEGVLRCEISAVEAEV